MINQAVVSFFLCFLLMLLSSSTTGGAVVKYDYSRLVLTWPRSFCLIKKDLGKPCKTINSLPSRFTVHGLWPDLLTGDIDPKTTPNCSTKKLDLMALPREVKQQANLDWPDLLYYTKNGGNGTQAEAVFNGLFWIHEWVEHGVCSNLEPRDYIELALHFYGQLLPNIIRATEQLPSPKDVIDVEDFKRRITQTSRVIPRLVCKNITQPPHDQYLEEIQFNVTSVPPYQLQDMLQSTNCVSSRQVHVKFPQ